MIMDLLPIGSVVVLKGGVKPVMVYGLKQVDTEKEETGYDYIGVLYPEGNLGPDFQYLFNHENIDKVIFKGYDSEEHRQFLEKVAKLYEEKK